MYQLSNGVKILFGIAGVIVVAGVAYFLVFKKDVPVENSKSDDKSAQVEQKTILKNETTTETSAFKTYESKTGKFSVEYPKEFLIREYAGEYEYLGNILNVAIGKNVADEKKSLTSDIFISVFDRYAPEDPLAMPNGMDPKGSIDMMIGGAKAKKYIDRKASDENGFGGYVVVNSATGFRYEITFDAGDAETLQAFDVIARSFRFIE